MLGNTSEMGQRLKSPRYMAQQDIRMDRLKLFINQNNYQLGLAIIDTKIMNDGFRFELNCRQGVLISENTIKLIKTVDPTVELRTENGKKYYHYSLFELIKTFFCVP
jgi:hypothetical protein